MDRILPVDDLMSEVWSMYTGRDLKEFIEGKDYNSKTLNFVKSKLHDLKAEKRGKLIKWLSVGVGEGRDLEVLYAEGLRPINIDFYGIDIIDNLFETVEKSASALGIKQVHLKAVRAEDMDFNQKFDLISAILVLHEVDPTKLPLILKNMLRLLKTGGTLVISDFQKPYELEKNVVVWDDSDIKYLLKQISPKTGASFEIMDSSEFPDEFGFYSCIIKKSGRISPRFFNRYKENITYFISTKIDNTQKDKEELTDQVKKRIEEITGEKEIDIDTLSNMKIRLRKNLLKKNIMRNFLR
ncbi:MAG: class I SAM-dependent methyltransferase [Methanosarcinaceae archaeon]